MKKQIITFGLLLAALSVTSCKNNETPTETTPVITAAPIQPEAIPADSTKQAQMVAKDSAKSSENEENGENEANEKNEKD